MNETQKLYQEHELWFVLGWIAFYVVAVSFADELSRTIGIEKIVTLPLLLVMCAVLLLWMKRNALFQTFGLCKGSVPPSLLLWYLLLAALISSNLWFGLRWHLSLHETLLYIASMICVGFIPGAPVQRHAQGRPEIRCARVQHGPLASGTLSTCLTAAARSCCPVGYAAAVGFLFVILFLKTGSLIPCIVTHSAVNSLSVFANEVSITATQEIFSAIAIAAIALAYAVYLLKRFLNKV